MKCSNDACQKSFHPLCAWYAGQFTNVYDSARHQCELDIQLFCLECAPAEKKTRRNADEQRVIRNRGRSMTKKRRGIKISAEEKARQERVRARSMTIVCTFGRSKPFHVLAIPLSFVDDTWCCNRPWCLTHIQSTCALSATARNRCFAFTLPNVCTDVLFGSWRNLTSYWDCKQEPGNAIVQCSGCKLSCHQSCYGVPDVSEWVGFQWRCRLCERSIGQVECDLCPRTGGLYKPTTTGGAPAHIMFVAACISFLFSRTDLSVPAVLRVSAIC